VLVFSANVESVDVGLLTDDCVVADTVKAEQVSLSQIRAKELKKEAISIRTSLARAAVETKTDDVDTAPLTQVGDEGAREETEVDEFYGGTGKWKQPEVIREEIFELEEISGEKRMCVFRENIPGKMYNFVNVLSKLECEQLRSLLDFSPIEEKIQLELIHGALAKKEYLIRTNIRRNFVDAQVARLIWRAVKNFLPSVLPDGRKLAGIRTKMNYYRYGPGQYFKTHVDGGYRFTATGETSEYTFIVYLNDDFQGGTTRFCPLSEWNFQARDVSPVQGGMLVFRHQDMKHCGAAITHGFKHILQGMVMYGPLRHNLQGKPFGKEAQLFYVTKCDC